MARRLGHGDIVGLLAVVAVQQAVVGYDRLQPDAANVVLAARRESVRDHASVAFLIVSVKFNRIRMVACQSFNTWA